jgi:hypothetical protein
MARYDDLDVKFIAFATLVSCLLLVATLQGTQALCYFMTNAEQAKKLDMFEYDSSKTVIGEQLESLNGYRKVAVPPATSRLQIPLERATQLMLEEAKSNQSKVSIGT